MAKSRTIRVTPNLQAWLVELEKAVKSMPAGEAKKKAQAGIAYMKITYAGKPQPNRGIICPPDQVIL